MATTEFLSGHHIKIVIPLNVVMASILLVFIFHTLTVWLPVADNEVNFWWPLSIIISILAFAVINTQITMDFILFKRFSHYQKAIETCQLWLRMAVSFEVILTLCFLTSIFYTSDKYNPFVVLVIVIGNMVSRALGLYVVKAHVTQLTTTIVIGPDPFVTFPPGTQPIIHTNIV